MLYRDMLSSGLIVLYQEKAVAPFPLPYSVPLLQSEKVQEEFYQ